jgi:L-amino acid N-acyltransferase YncA
MIIRDYAQVDLPAILAIYNDAVANSTAIWNDRLVDLEDRRAWAAARVALGYPLLVAEIDGSVAGYATFGDFRAFDGYRHTVEQSVYVGAAFRRRGIARALLQTLEPYARALGKHALLGGIEAGNAASLSLHAELGFKEVGRLPEVGTKFGRWLDLVFMQKILARAFPDRMGPSDRQGIAPDSIP